MIAGWATVLGLGIWLPGFPNAAAWRQGGPGGDFSPPPQRLPVRLRRRASLLTRMVAEVAAQAAEQAGVGLQGLPVVMGSAYGELMTTMEMLHELETNEPLSPFRFHNSVHNTATGYLSIGADSQASSTALAAGNDTVPMVLQEALALLADRGGDVLAIVADEELPRQLATASSPPLAGALVLRACRPETTTTVAVAAAGPVTTPLAWLGDLRQTGDDDPTAERPVEENSPCATFLRLAAAVQNAVDVAQKPTSGPAWSSARVELTAGAVPRWSLSVASSSPFGSRRHDDHR